MGLLHTQKGVYLKKLLLIVGVIGFLTTGLAHQTKGVTQEEKQKFMAFLKTLKTKGEFFTSEAVAKAIPYQNILFALTENDLRHRDIYPYLALSGDLIEHPQCQAYALKHFQSIQHPMLKMGWGVMLLQRDKASPEIVRYLFQVLQTPKQRKTLQSFSGPEFLNLEGKVQKEYQKLK